MAYSAKELKVLVIEDNAGDLLLIQEYLEDEVRHPLVVNAKDLSSALRILETGQDFDAVLLDLTLPDGSGKGLINTIVRAAGTAPVIVLTGYSEKEFSVRTLSLGVADYLLKDELTSAQLYKSIVYSIERTRVYRQLNKSEEEYRNLFQFSPMPMWIYDMETLKFLNVNDSALNHYGYSLSEFQQMTLYEIRVDEGIELVPSILDGLKKKGSTFDGRSRHRLKSGKIIDVEIKASLTYFDGKEGILVLINDITEKLAREEEIARSNEKLQASEKIGKLGYWESNVKTGQLYWSEEAYTMLGVPRGTELNYDFFYSLVHPEDRGLFDKEKQESFTEHREFSLEHRMLKMDGGSIYVFQKGSVTFNEQGDPVRFVGIIQDISERVKSTRAIQDQNKKLRKIAWMQSHVIRAPLSRIMGLVSILQNHNPTPQETSEYLEYITISAEELDSVIKNIVIETDSIDFTDME